MVLQFKSRAQTEPSESKQVIKLYLVLMGGSITLGLLSLVAGLLAFRCKRKSQNEIWDRHYKQIISAASLYLVLVTIGVALIDGQFGLLCLAGSMCYLFYIGTKGIIRVLRCPNHRSFQLSSDPGCNESQRKPHEGRGA